MDTNSVLKQLGYADSPFFLRGKRLLEDPGYSHFFRKATDSCRLVGVYALRQPAGDNQGKGSIIPTVYVCKADNETTAEDIHRRVWNQNIVPYLVVVTKKNVRLYSGFEYDRSQSDEERVLEVAKDANEILSKLSAFSSDSIDSGDIWKQQKISTEKRVDRRLLANLDKLSEVLTGEDYGLSKTDAHSLIGKYVYLKYLRDRDILSDARLLDAGVNKEHVFSRRSQKEKLYVLEDYLDEFLNGSVFPLPSGSGIQTKHVQKVAGIFMGDDPDSRQMHLDFKAYDFSYIPIETLSVVYQQFLHEKGEGRSKGAYYTPVHLVNFILDELEAKKPLEEGMKVFDPSCGSGAFLVQCYRRLVEKVSGKEGKLRPTRLRELLVDHVFGLDADEEACRVAQLSLSLTLLDYIDPPDLSKTNFKLPNLDGQNIFHCEGGFFDKDCVWTGSMPKDGYDWIVGNPPWKKLKTSNIKEKYDTNALGWIKKHAKTCPVGRQEVAEAFAWKVHSLLSQEGQCGLVLPALSLFNKDGHDFRREFFTTVEVWCIVNFANIRRYLFEGATNPAAAFFFSGKKDWDKAKHYITTAVSSNRVS